MTAVQDHGNQDLLGSWMTHPRRDMVQQPPDEGDVPGGLRFAFYGRTSTVDHQDRATSSGWQREVAESVIAGQGAIVAEFFDTGCSRRLPWADRPRAAALLSALENAVRPFDVIVVGEYERAFFGSQFLTMAALFQRHGVQIWLPEACGPVDVGCTEHRALVALLGAQSQREVLRSRHRVLAAMQAQACEQGRYLGGRPPYGYRLVDAGPHPNRADARWGRRLRRLDPDPVTAPHVVWMFQRRLAGDSVASIARELNDRGVPCPSFVDAARNRHRSGEAWTLRTVVVILGNPRYTGRQVWNRHRTDHESRKPGGGRRAVHHMNPSREWVVSKMVAHPALVTERDFVAVQAIRAARETKDGATRTYLLAGLVRCRVCWRRMDAHWVNRRPGYRCRHGHSSARGRVAGQPKNLYVREDHLLAGLALRLTDCGLDTEEQDNDGTRRACDIVAFLHVNDLMIICDATGWMLDSNNPMDPAVASTLESMG